MKTSSTSNEDNSFELMRAPGGVGAYVILVMTTLPLIFSHLSILFALGCSVAAIIFLIVLFLRSRKPLILLDDEKFCYWGFWPWLKINVPKNEIVEIRMLEKSRRPPNLISMSITTNSGAVRINLLSYYDFQIPQMLIFLRENYKNRFIELR